MRRRYLLAGYLLLAAIAAVQQWALQRPGDPYTHYNNYVIFRQSFFHLVGQQDLYLERLDEHWDFFRYSPSFALAFGAFAWMPDLAGLLLWDGLNAAVLFLAWTMLPVSDDRLGLAAGWFVAVEMMTALQNAQSNVLIAGLLVLAFAALERRRVALGALLIVAASFVKLFGLAALVLCVFYPQKRRFVLATVISILAIGLLPLLVVSPGQLANLYASWGRQLSTDYAATGVSLFAILESWFHIAPPKSAVTLIGAGVLVFPLAFVGRYRDFGFRLLFLCTVLIWVVIFNHKAESSSYVIAMCGVALWFFAREPSRVSLVLALTAFVLTSLSPTDVFPRSLSAAFFVPYAIKAAPCVLIWAKITYELVSGPPRLRVSPAGG